nr:hypothetical protein CFP56_11954 [Quercus suber]
MVLTSLLRYPFENYRDLEVFPDQWRGGGVDPDESLPDLTMVSCTRGHDASPNLYALIGEWRAHEKQSWRVSYPSTPVHAEQSLCRKSECPGKRLFRLWKPQERKTSQLSCRYRFSFKIYKIVDNSMCSDSQWMGDNPSRTGLVQYHIKLDRHGTRAFLTFCCET